MHLPSPLELPSRPSRPSRPSGTDSTSSPPSLSPTRAVRRVLARLEPRLALALAVVWILWGSTYLAMRIAVTALPPFGMAGARFVVAGIGLLAYTRARGEAWPTRRAWLVAVPAGALLFLGGNGFVVLAEKTVPSSVAAVVCATTPLVASVISAIRGERPRVGEIIGMVLGLVGVVVLGAGTPLAGAGLREMLIAVSPIAFALGSLIVRAQGPSGGLASAAAQMIAGGVWLLAASRVLGERLPAHIPSCAVLAWLWLVVLGSLVGFSAYSWLLRNSRPAVAMSYAYVNPIVAVVLGAMLGGECFGAATVAATGLIAAGVMSAVLFRR